MTKWQQWRLNMLFFRGPKTGYHTDTMMGRVLFDWATLRVSWDRDHYKRLALRAKLTTSGLLTPAFVTQAGYTVYRQYCTAAEYVTFTQRQRELRHNARVFKRYERRVVPSPFVTALQEELSGFVVDLAQMEERLFRRVLRDSLRRQWRYRILWPLVKWFAVKYAVAIEIPNDKGR